MYILRQIVLTKHFSKKCVLVFHKSYKKFDDGMFLLSAAKDNVVLCFFNSLFTISSTTENLKNKLCEALQNKKNFYIVCDYTINNNYHMPKEEQDFIGSLLKKLSVYFQFQQLEILNGRGIIISATK